MLTVTERFQPVRFAPVHMGGLGKHRPPGSGGGNGGGAGGLTWLGQTSFPRPAFNTSRTVPFTTKAEMDAAIANMQPGDYIKYTGNGVLNVQVSSGTGSVYTLSGKNPTAQGVVIDFGCSRNQWDTSTVTGAYVKFSYTGTGQGTGFFINNCSNLKIYGGEYTTGQWGSRAIYMYAGHDITMWDTYVSMCGESGWQIGPNSSTPVYNISFRGEVNRFCMNPASDSHDDKGTGLHGAILHTGTGQFHDCTWIIHAHDPLLPGEHSAGQDWVEGGGGSALEPGMVSGGNLNNHTFYVKGENLLMNPSLGTNPGSTAKQTAGNGMTFWGAVPMTNNVVGWVEATNCTGAVVECSGGAWHNVTPPVTVKHGRGHNVNQFVGLSNIAIPYDNRYGIDYQDCILI